MKTCKILSNTIIMLEKTGRYKKDIVYFIGIQHGTLYCLRYVQNILLIHFQGQIFEKAYRNYNLLPKLFTK